MGCPWHPDPYRRPGHARRPARRAAALRPADPQLAEERSLTLGRDHSAEQRHRPAARHGHRGRFRRRSTGCPLTCAAMQDLAMLTGRNERDEECEGSSSPWNTLAPDSAPGAATAGFRSVSTPITWRPPLSPGILPGRVPGWVSFLPARLEQPAPSRPLPRLRHRSPVHSPRPDRHRHSRHHRLGRLSLIG